MGEPDVLVNVHGHAEISQVVLDRMFLATFVYEHFCRRDGKALAKVA